MPVPLRTERDFGRSVKSVHSPVRAFINDGQGGIGGAVQGGAEGLGLLALGLADDPVDHLVVRVVGHTHAHLDTWKRIGAQMLNDVLQAIVEVGGANSVYACASHGVLSGPALERLNNSVIKEVALLNTIPESMGEGCDKIKYISVAPMFAEAIERIYQEISIAKLFN